MNIAERMTKSLFYHRLWERQGISLQISDQSLKSRIKMGRNAKALSFQALVTKKTLLSLSMKIRSIRLESGIMLYLRRFKECNKLTITSQLKYLLLTAIHLS